MARPKQNQEQTEPTHYDKFLVDVTREAGVRGGPVTKSVTIGKLERGAIPNRKVTMDALNATQEHQNPSALGYPVIQWYFPVGAVKTGETYKANDIHLTMEDEETGEKVKINNHDGTPKIIGLNITDKKIIGYAEGKNGKQGKPIFEGAEE